MNTMNPWAGLASYEDPAKAEHQLKFCGRDDDSYDVAKLIMGNVFVTLYGKSGIGKTSLLNAGVFPELREEQYTPISLRLGMRDEEHHQSYPTIIIEALERTVSRFETINVINEQEDDQAVDYLWNFFARHRFFDKNDNPTIPVIVMDQFEEVFRSNREEAETLLRQLDYLNDRDHRLDNCTIDGESYRYEQNFRFVVSIREDDLYRLEDSLDNCYLPALKRCRYRLRSLSEQGARDAILIPGEGLFLPNEQDDIAKSIIDKSKNADGSISTNIISLLCSRIFVDFQQSKSDHIAKSLVESFIKGNPFEQFYNEATRGFSNREKSYIEDHLVDSTGRRNSIPESDFLRYVKNGTILMDGSRRILQRTNTSADGNSYRVELIHDSFCEPLEGQKTKRQQRRKVRFFAMSFVVFLCILSGLWLYINQIENAKNKLKENEILNAVKKSQIAMNNGDSYEARIQLLSVLPEKASDCPPAIEEALRTASAHESTILIGHEDAVNYAKYNDDETKIISASYDGTVKIWDVRTGLCEKTFIGHTDGVWSADFCPDGKSIISYSKDKTIKIWDIEMQKVIKENEGSGNEFYIEYSPDRKKLFMVFNDSIKIVDARTYQCLMAFKNEYYRDCLWFDDDVLLVENKNHFRKQNVVTGHSEPLMYEKGEAVLVSMAIDVKKTKIATAYGYKKSDKPGYVKVWDAQTGNYLHTLCSNEYWVNGVGFSPDGKLLASTSMGGQVMLWDANNGACVDILKGHSFASSGPEFSKDGNQLVTVSADNTIRIWDVDNGRDSVEIVKGTGESDYCYVSYSPDGKQFLLVSLDSICLFDSETKQRIKTLEKQNNAYVAFFSPNGDCIGAILNDGIIGIQNLATGQWKRFKAHGQFINQLSFSKDGKHILSSSDDKTIRNWNVETGECTQTIECSAEVMNAQFINNNRVIYETVDSTITVWDFSTNKCVNSWKIPVYSYYLAFFKNPSPDGKYYITTEHNAVKVWDIETGQCVSTLQGHTSVIYSCAFSPNGKYLVTTSHDCQVKVWDWRSGVCVYSRKLYQYTNSSFSPDGNHIALTCPYETRIIDFPSLQQLIDETRARFKSRTVTNRKADSGW